MDKSGGWACLELLRRYEGYGYQTAYYLLGNEADALAAVKAALMELAADHRLASLPEPEQRQHIRRAVSYHALSLLKLAVPAV